ncbi:DNA-binding MarR family transcriptional regulator [Arthrobacter ginsengisoli]|uniref:DNA-binding MarR family transcriptional regulator n=1 Tax=Arthrobacter ginsengisoli TaxID=1356565 RepID=A0ABU1UDP2_9MICC|nr:MarR family transcriptional regulator [Arthrobacter ginsengisoli]MDR7083324.1 DNA-binding MarR family transcriptional regulator [Arthrobacter ginsengisoli]
MTISKETGDHEAGDSTRPDILAIELRTAVMRTSRRLRAEATGDVITPGQYTVLAQLRKGPQTLRELAEREHVQAPSMTRIVNALTGQGFVSRTAHPTDGRQIRVTITPAGEDVLAEAREQRTAWLAHRVAGLSAEDRLILSRAAHLMQKLSAR